MKNFENKTYTDAELKELFHNDHEAIFFDYINKSRHTSDKANFLFNWLKPKDSDYILECGSSSGKTCIDLTLRSNCNCLGVDFDEDAIEISKNMRDKYFPSLRDKCTFVVGDLTKMKFDPQITKILMPDFTEHIPDHIFRSILLNMREQFSEVDLYIYTPNRRHLFEILKHNNIGLKNKSGHINVKTREGLIEILEDAGWKVIESSWHYSAIPIIKLIEILMVHLPYIGKYFKRRIVIKASF